MQQQENRITQWSFSRLNDYRKCPAFAKYKHIDKLKEPGNAAMDRGSAIHKLAENYSQGTKKDKLPPELAFFEKEFKALQKRPVVAEEKWALTAPPKWEPTEFFAKDVWVRLVLDCIVPEEHEAEIIDYKTGKPYERNKESLSLYAIGGFQYCPTVKTIKAGLWYLDTGEKTEVEFKREELPKLQKYWVKETKKMLSDTTFEPTPGNACRWCHFSKGKGGPCKAG